MEDQEMDSEMQAPTQEVLSQPQRNKTITPTDIWQSKHDTNLRRNIVENIGHIFQGQYPLMTVETGQQIYDRLRYLLCSCNRRHVYHAGFLGQFPQMTVEMWQQLPVLVKHMEEALYKRAPSKAEYANLQTLETRLCAMLDQMVLNEYSPYLVAPRGNMIPSTSTQNLPRGQVPHWQSELVTDIAIRLESNIRTYQSTFYTYF